MPLGGALIGGLVGGLLGGISAGPFSSLPDMDEGAEQLPIGGVGEAGAMQTGGMPEMEGLGQWADRGLGIPDLPSIPSQMGGPSGGLLSIGSPAMGAVSGFGGKGDYKLEAEEWKKFFSLTDSQRVKEIARGRMEAAGERLADSARGFAPVDTGALRRSIQARWQGGDTLEVSADVPYAGAVEGGTSPHWVPISELAGWASRHGIPVGALQRSIAHKGTRAHPFMEPAWNATAGQMEQIMGEMWGQVLEEGGRIQVFISGGFSGSMGAALQDLGTE